MDKKAANFPATSSFINNRVEPKRFSFFPSKLDSTVHAAGIGDLLLPGESFHDLFDTGRNEGVWWLDVLSALSSSICYSANCTVTE
jgi:hypothetical protein